MYKATLWCKCLFEPLFDMQIYRLELYSIALIILLSLFLTMVAWRRRKFRLMILAFTSLCLSKALIIKGKSTALLS